MGARAGRSPDRRCAHRGLASIRRNGLALSRIVDDILDVSRIVSGKLRIEKKRIDLSEVVLSSLETARAAARDKRVALSEHVTPQCPIEGDPMRLAQVVSNLVANAIKFTPEGGSVEVALTAGEQGATLSVRDTGFGIDAADLPHIFESFRQVDQSPTRTNPGLGLGLAIAHHLVEAHGGTIEARSEGKGRGALFTVRLPHLLGEALQAREPGPSRTIAGVKVLYVDDAVDVLETLAVVAKNSFGRDSR